MSQPDYHSRITAMAVVYDPEPDVFAETTTHVRIADEGAGEFVELEQSGGIGLGKIQINQDEWPVLRDTIDKMIEQCRKD